MNEKIKHADPANVEEIWGETLPEAHIRAQKERARQERLEKIQRERANLDDLKQRTEFETIQTELFIEGCKNILKDNLAAGIKADWASLYNDLPYPPFVFRNPAPRYNQVARETGVPSKDLLSELLSPAVKKERLQKEGDAKNAYALKMKLFEEEKESQRAAHVKERDSYISAQSEYNNKVEQLQLDFEKGRPAAIQSFARIVLNRITMPDPVTVYYDAVYQPDEKLLVVDALLPPYYDLPRAVSYQYNREAGEIITIEMKEREYDVFYLDIIQQIALIAMHTILNTMPARYVQTVGLNSWVENIKIGNTLDTKSCILTCKAAREAFSAMALAQRSPAECFSELNGQTAKSFAGADEVQPVIIIETLSGTGELKQEADNPTATKPPEYKPGEFKQVTTKIVSEMLEEIEKSLLQSTRGKDDVIH
jgi:restriction system protein